VEANGLRSNAANPYLWLDAKIDRVREPGDLSEGAHDRITPSTGIGAPLTAARLDRYVSMWSRDTRGVRMVARGQEA
jgi:hypothetical protein